jgi:hypothetical protein
MAFPATRSRAVSKLDFRASDGRGQALSSEFSRVVTHAAASFLLWAGRSCIESPIETYSPSCIMEGGGGEHAGCCPIASRKWEALGPLTHNCVVGTLKGSRRDEGRMGEG